MTGTLITVAATGAEVVQLSTGGNPWGFIKDLYQLTQERGVVPEFELFDFGHIATLMTPAEARAFLCIPSA
jgi:hypothetical protein